MQPQYTFLHLCTCSTENPNVAQYNNKIPMRAQVKFLKILKGFRIDFTNTQNKFSKDMMELQVTFISQCMKETIEKLFPLEVV